uniref:TSA: Wollemia nobilis Ref_Wollemi_Transcript_29400_1080 transcribed RNA sequence n=1 Tax=Wollemia nobilis TaxID=56998 RepID=A0A0C9QKY6_9CONI
MAASGIGVGIEIPVRSHPCKIRLPICASAREKCYNKGASQPFYHFFYNHQSIGIGGVAFNKKRLACGQRVLVKAVLGKKSTKRETVIPSPDYRIPVILTGFAGALIYKDNLLLATPIGLLGLLLFFQTTRVRFVFDDEALEVRVGNELKESGENVFVGGKNRWKYSSFVNWELWWPNFPILVYFKETQTKPEGQVHFFPVIFNGKQLYDVMVERAGPSKTSVPN